MREIQRAQRIIPGTRTTGATAPDGAIARCTECDPSLANACRQRSGAVLALPDGGVYLGGTAERCADVYVVSPFFSVDSTFTEYSMSRQEG